MALTPMMQQYLETKESNPDSLLLFRLGDFYELFFEDAEVASKVLEITLTGRGAGEQGRVPMCGVPYHAANQYIGRLIDAGYSVAICEQVEDPKQAKGLVRREIVRIVTPGTWTREGEESRYLAALVPTHRGTWGFAITDVSTGELWFGSRSTTDNVLELLMQWNPIEVLIGSEERLSLELVAQYQAVQNCKVTRLDGRTGLTSRNSDKSTVLLSQYGVLQSESLGLPTGGPETIAVCRMVAYLQETQKQILTHLKAPRQFDLGENLTLDATAIRNLELLETQRTRQKKGSLFGLLDQTQTAMGSRLLRQWLSRPLADVKAISERLDSVEWLAEQLFVRAEVTELLARVYDLERLIGRIGFGTAHARDLVAIADSLSVVPRVTQCLGHSTASRIRELCEHMPILDDLVDMVRRTFVEQPPTATQDGGMVREGVDDSLDELRRLSVDGKTWLAEFERQERESTGIKSLKIGYNKVFGYYIEVSKANQHLVPEHYHRKQTLASAERYTVASLKEQEDRILHAQERAVAREYEIFSEVRDGVSQQIPAMQTVAEGLAELDVLTAFASVSVEHNYVRPKVVPERGVAIRGGRHPMVEAAAPGSFVQNDVHLTSETPFILLTGPNMAGKSTYMRQAALISIMAHMGCFVPAQEATIGCLDRVFTRIGASDDLGGGQSTFMVEMVELAEILRQATSRSLILLDEIGRGTSTYDGMSLAEAVMETLVEQPENPLSLFATHYHELTVRAKALSQVRNLSVAVKETESGVVFLHSVVERPADRSYGIQVAKLAGVPEPVIERATRILQEREAEAASAPGRHASLASGQDVAADGATGEGAIASAETAATLVTRSEQAEVQRERERIGQWLNEVAAMKVQEMTPIEAIARLDDVVRQAREVTTWDVFKSCRKS